jgi:hypothetical protein
MAMATVAPREDPVAWAIFPPLVVPAQCREHERREYRPGDGIFARQQEDDRRHDRAKQHGRDEARPSEERPALVQRPCPDEHERGRQDHAQALLRELLDEAGRPSRRDRAERDDPRCQERSCQRRDEHPQDRARIEQFGGPHAAPPDDRRGDQRAECQAHRSGELGHQRILGFEYLIGGEHGDREQRPEPRAAQYQAAHRYADGDADRRVSAGEAMPQGPADATDQGTGKQH